MPPHQQSPRLDSQFFPPGEEGHHGFTRELRKHRGLLRPGISEPADVDRALQEGYVAAFEFLLDIPMRPSALDPVRIGELHGQLFGRLFLDAGQFRKPSQPTIFGQRVGADAGDFVPRFTELQRQTIQHSATWDGPVANPEDKPDRLHFIASYHGALVLLHPFRDGNGRLARLIAWWQELCIVGLARQVVPRETYMTGMRALPGDMRLLLNFFLERHQLPITTLDPLPPLFPIWQPPSEGD